MRKVLLFICLIAVFSCNKDKSDYAENSKEKLLGRWVITRSINDTELPTYQLEFYFNKSDSLAATIYQCNECLGTTQEISNIDITQSNITFSYFLASGNEVIINATIFNYNSMIGKWSDINGNVDNWRADKY